MSDEQKLYNQQILDKIVQKYGAEKAIDFCAMNAYKHHLMIDSGVISPTEDEYEKQWWLQAGERLFRKTGNY